jgi:16S rRNA (uracil1498-N3)-methyltransferase
VSSAHSSGEWRAMTRKTPHGSTDALRRFFVPPNSIAGTQVLFPADEARHAATVLRLHVGDQVVVIDGTGVERTVVLTEVGPGKVAGRVVETRAVSQRGVLALIQGVPKGAKMDDVVRMGTELGVSEFFPFLSKRTVAEGRGRIGRWQRIAVESAKQSRRSDVPVVYAPAPLQDVLVHIAGYNLIVMLWEGAPGQSREHRHYRGSGGGSCRDGSRRRRGTWGRAGYPGAADSPDRNSKRRGASDYPIRAGEARRERVRMTTENG